MLFENKLFIVLPANIVHSSFCWGWKLYHQSSINGNEHRSTNKICPQQKIRREKVDQQAVLLSIYIYIEIPNIQLCVIYVCVCMLMYVRRHAVAMGYDYTTKKLSRRPLGERKKTRPKRVIIIVSITRPRGVPKKNKGRHPTTMYRCIYVLIVLIAPPGILRKTIT